MKKTLSILILAALCACSSNSTSSSMKSENKSATNSRTSTTVSNTQGIPVAHGKEFVKEQFEESYMNLAKALKGLTEEQMEFKPSPDRWSISETLEHIVKTEPALLEWLQGVMKQPANPQDRKDITVTDDQVLVMMTDRSHKAKASAELQPKGKYPQASQGLKDLTTQRASIFKYLDSVSMEDLRNHVTDSPGGKVDGYQVFLFIPGHTMRHTLQIQEIKADPNFPKN